MTPEEKILKLIEYIKEEFPAGCGCGYGIDCKNCPLSKVDEHTIEGAVCDLLEQIYWCS